MKKMNIALAISLALMMSSAIVKFAQGISEPITLWDIDHNCQKQVKYEIKSNTLSVNLSHQGLTDVRDLERFLKMCAKTIPTKNDCNFGTLKFDIDLSHNALESFAVDSLGELHGVANLNLSNNRLRALPQDFAKLASLAKLDLSNNSFTELPFIVSYLPSLRKLNLSDNSFNNETIDSFTNFLDMFNFITIAVKDIPNLTDTIARIAGSLPNKYIKIKKNDLNQYITISTRYKNLGDIPREMLLARFAQGDYLNLSGLGLTNIEGIDKITVPNSDKELVSLGEIDNLTIDLSDNHLESLPENFSDIAPVFIDLSFNRFTELPSQLFDLEQLLSLNISHNMITKLPATIDRLNFDTEEFDTDIDLSYNKLKTLPGSFFLIKCTYINLSNNELETVPKYSEEGLLIDHFSPHKLNLSYNKLKKLPDSFFLMQFQLINISHNELEALPEYIESNKPRYDLRYRTLDASNNQLTTLPESFTQFKRLTGITLAHNRFDIFPPQMSSMHSLERIDLSNNRISSIPVEITQLKQLYVLTLGNNTLKALPDTIGQLSNLGVLDISNNDLIRLPLGITKLSKLDSLILDGNPLGLQVKFNNKTNHFEGIYYIPYKIASSVEDEAIISLFLTKLAIKKKLTFF